MPNSLLSVKRTSEIFILVQAVICHKAVNLPLNCLRLKLPEVGHLRFLPLTKDKRLSAKDIIGNRNKLVEWQDKFYDYMAAEFPLLKRGESAAAVTKRKHVPTWLFKQANHLTQEMSAIQNEIENIGAFNSGKQKEKILKILLEWFPQVNAFESKLKPYEQQIKILEDNQRAIENQSRSKDAQVYHAELATQDLSYQLQEYQKFVDSIPEKLRGELLLKYQAMQEQQEQNYTL